MKRFHGTVLTALLCTWSAVYGAGQASPRAFALTNPPTIDAMDFGLKTGEDPVPAIRAALQACRERGATKLVFPKGDYRCYSDMATEKYLRISNNDNGMKRVVFPLEGMKDFEIDGQGSRFIMHGHMVAFDVEGCENIILRNFSIDWGKPFYFQGKVVATDESTNSFDLKVFEECDYQIVAHELLFLEKAGKAVRTWKQWAIPVKSQFGWEQNIDWNIWYDSKTKAPALMGESRLLRSYNEKLKVRYHAEEIEPGLVSLFSAKNFVFKGNTIAPSKTYPISKEKQDAFHIRYCKDVHIEDNDSRLGEPVTIKTDKHSQNIVVKGNKGMKQ